MKLNSVGKLGLNSPTRGFVQRHFVSAFFERLGGSIEGGKALEIGCGQGAGAEIILDRFHAAELEAIDIDSEMVERARVRLAHRPQARISIGDATHIAAPNASLDAVFDFGAIHQMPDWRGAVAEVSRALKPGGLFFFEEVASRPFRWLLRLTIDGWPPPAGDSFTRARFIAELEAQGLAVERRMVRPAILYVLTAFSFGLVGDLVGVAKRTLSARSPSRPAES